MQLTPAAWTKCLACHVIHHNGKRWKTLTTHITWQYNDRTFELICKYVYMYSDFVLHFQVMGRFERSYDDDD